MSDAVEVDAKVIDDEVTKLDGLELWLSETSAKMSEKAKGYDAFPVTDEETHSRAYNDLRAIGRDIKEVKEQRMAMTRVLDDAKKRAMQAERDATKALTDIQAKLKANDDSYKQMRIDEKRAELQQAFEDAAPDLALPFEGNAKPLVSFDLLLERYGNNSPKWLNFGTNVELAKSKMLDALTLIANDEADIESIVNADDVDAVKAVYFATLDKSEALHKAAELKEQRERLKRLEEERKARMEWQEAMQPAQEAMQPMQEGFSVLDHYVDNIAQPVPGDDVPEYVFMAYIPASMRSELIAYFKQVGIHGTMKRTNGRKFELREA